MVSSNEYSNEYVNGYNDALTDFAEELIALLEVDFITSKSSIMAVVEELMK